MTDLARPSRTQVSAAVETLTAAGFSFSGPALDRMQLLSARRVADLLDVSDDTARRIMKGLPGSLVLPGGALRCRSRELEQFLDTHPARISV